MKKNDKSKNVYELTQERLAVLFKEFDNILCVIFRWEGQWSAAESCIDYIRGTI